MTVATPRLKERYRDTIQAELKEQFQHGNVMEVARLDKIVVNMGVGDAPTDKRFMEMALDELSTITGQRPSVRRARKAISNFKLRKGLEIGCMVTLRGDRMYEFLDRLFNMAIPRIRDFRGMSANAFDRQGHYTIGLREQTIFPELNIDKVQRVRGMNITFVIKNPRSKEESFELLKKLGMPFQPN